MRVFIMYLFNISDLVYNYMYIYDFIFQFEKIKEDIVFICFFKQLGWWYMKTIQKFIIQGRGIIFKVLKFYVCKLNCL